MVDVRYWIWLSLRLGPAFKHTASIISAFSDAKNVYDASCEELKETGLDAELIDVLADKDVSETNSIYSYCIKNHITLLSYDSESYPARLKKIKDPPLLLYCAGVLPDIDDNVCIATVGTRRITEYGRREAYTISRDLACAGAVIISGLALGIDAVCHRACLDAYGKTVAVLGCGIDIIYPRENFELFDEIAKTGAIITEYAPGTRPLPQNFPRRNRIISGLSLGTLVLEADRKSGALITARTALEQGRDLFALPGKVGEINSLGTNDLIKNGAKMVTGAQDILEEYECLFPHRIRIENIPKFPAHFNAVRVNTPKNTFSKAKKDDQTHAFKIEASSNAKNDLNESNETSAKAEIARDTSMLDETSLKVLGKMKKLTPVSPDELVDTELTISDIMVAMTVLEINKFVKNLPGGMFVRE